jgi:hypothetical protein
MGLLKERTDEITNLLEAAAIIDVAMKQTQGKEKLTLNNAMAHVLSRVYQNGYIAGNGIY